MSAVFCEAVLVSAVVLTVVQLCRSKHDEVVMTIIALQIFNIRRTFMFLLLELRRLLNRS